MFFYEQVCNISDLPETKLIRFFIYIFIYRYLRCPAAVSVAHLEKLIEAKYDLNEKHRVEILYNQDSLNSTLTLMDISCIYLWKKVIFN